MVALQVIAIDVDDPLAKDLNDIADVEKLLPGYVSGIREWFRWYKTPDDKPLNGFGFGEKALSKVRASDTLRRGVQFLLMSRVDISKDASCAFVS